MSQGCNGRAYDPCCPEAVRCQDSSVACAAFWMISRAVACSSLSSALKYVKVAVSMTSDSQELLREKACRDCVTDHVFAAWLR